VISSFEVGAIFRIVNEASPALRQILKQVRELDLAIGKARENLALVGRGAAAGLSSAVGETQALAVAWREVAAASALATRNLTGAGAAGRSAAASAAVGGGGGRGGGRHRPGWLGGGGAHVSGPGIGVPGGGHVRFGAGAGGAGMAAAGLVGYGAYQAAEMEDAVWQLIYHSGLEQNDANRGKFRKMIQDSMVESGYGIHDIGEAAKQEMRMFQGTPGGGIDVLPEMLRAATIEARLKGESPESSMKALIGLAHMTKQYSPEAIKKLAPAFAFLSTANPGSLGSIEKAAGYAVPLLQSGLDIDPMTSLLMGTALTRAGATSTKSGTWLREMALRAMPGTSLMSKMAFRKHEEALKALGLVDDSDKPTWFTDGKPDLFKMLDIAGGRASSIPLEKRAAYERSLFGAQGGGGFALLSDPAVREQVQSLRGTMDSPEFKNRYAGFMQNYNSDVTAQAARTAMQGFNVTLGDLGARVLPGINHALQDFKSVLEGIRGIIPGVNGGAVAGARAIEGAVAGAIGGAGIGLAGGPVGALGGAVIGGIGGGAYGIAEQYMAGQHASLDPATIKSRLAAVVPPLSISFNIDGTLLGRVLSNISTYSFSGQAPAFDGTGEFALPHHQDTSN
jgi:hypothetical protein